MKNEVISGYKMTDIGVIPENWDCVLLERIQEVIDGDRGVNYPCSSDLLNDGYCLFLSAKNVTSEGFRFIECTFITESNDKRMSKGKLRRGDYILTTRGTVGNFAFYNKTIPFNDMRINSGMVILRCRDLQVDGNYIYEVLRSLHVKYQIERFVFGSAQPQLTVRIIKSIQIPVPPLPEQRAIATALSDVDALTSSLDKLIAKKRDIKQAAMQQLLTGKKRLPGFSGEWEVKTLGDCLLSTPDYGINAPAVPFTDNLSVYIRITDITDDSRFSRDNIASVQQQNADQYYLDKGDLVFARTGASVGKSYLFNQKDGNMVFAGFLIRIRPNPTLLHSNYLANYVRTTSYWNWVKVMSMRSGQPGINSIEYAQLPVQLPTIKEQTAIATVLSDMDAEIAALEQKRDKTRLIKQGMMQELLTGRIRLV